jgi:flavodoxin
MAERILVVYYSLDGNTRFIAENIAGELRADTWELKVKDEVPPTGFMRYIWGGRQVFKEIKPQLALSDIHPKDYDIVFIGTPVWAFTYAPALASFFLAHRLTSKKLAFFCCSGGHPGATLDNMKTQLPGNLLLGEIHFVKPLATEKEKAAERARSWARSLIR